MCRACESVSEVYRDKDIYVFVEDLSEDEVKVLLIPRTGTLVGYEEKVDRGYFSFLEKVEPDMVPPEVKERYHKYKFGLEEW